MNQLKEVLFATSYDEEHHPDNSVDDFDILTGGEQDKEFIVLKLKGQIKISRISFAQINITTLWVECFNTEPKASHEMQDIIESKKEGSVLLRETFDQEKNDSVPKPCSFASENFKAEFKTESEFNTIKITFSTCNKKCKKMGLQSIEVLGQTKEETKSKNNGGLKKLLNGENKAKQSKIVENTRNKASKFAIIKNLKKKTGLDKITKTNFQTRAQKMISMTKTKINESFKNFKWKRKSAETNNVSPEVPPKKQKTENSSPSTSSNSNGHHAKTNIAEVTIDLTQTVNMAECPLCFKKFPQDTIEMHASNCDPTNDLVAFTQDDDVPLQRFVKSPKNNEHRKVVRKSLRRSVSSTRENGTKEEHKEKKIMKMNGEPVKDLRELLKDRHVKFSDTS